jgi:hypothetical protein
MFVRRGVECKGLNRLSETLAHRASTRSAGCRTRRVPDRRFSWQPLWEPPWHPPWSLTR